MPKLDHLALPVANVAQVQSGYTSVLGLEVEFESLDPPAVGLKDDADFTIILTPGEPATMCNLYFRVDDVDRSYRELGDRGVEFQYAPQINDCGYGAGLSDPDGRLSGL